MMCGDSHHLPAGLFVQLRSCQYGIIIIWDHSESAIILVFAQLVDVNRVKVQMKCQSSEMEKPDHLQCA